MGTGPLHVPKLPGIDGIGDFTGHSFHTSRWDYDYTGGDASGAPMERLADQRVAVIGTGATSVQCVPRLARRARSCTSSSARLRRWTPLVRDDRNARMAAALARQLHGQPEPDDARGRPRAPQQRGPPRCPGHRLVPRQTPWRAGYFGYLTEWRDKGDFAGLEFR